MRILFAYFNGGGGGLSNIILLIGAMAKQFPDDQIDVISSPAVDFSPLEGMKNVTLRRLAASGAGEIGRLRFSISGLRRIARELRSDVVWAMNLGMYLRCSVPQVLSINNAYQTYPISCLKLHPAGLFSAGFLRFFSTLSIRASCGIVVQSEVMKAQLVQRGINAKPILVSPKSVESSGEVDWKPLPETAAKMLDKSEGSGVFDFLYVATGFPHKNHRVVVDAIRRLRAEGRESRLIVTIDREELRGLCGNMAEELVGEGAIVPLGWVDKSHLRALYEASDACVMPSILESQSSAHLEAMAWSRAQVSSDSEYARELCGDASLYADPRSPAEWARAMGRISDSSELRAELVRRGHARMLGFPTSWARAAVDTRDFLFKAVVERRSLKS